MKGKVSGGLVLGEGHPEGLQTESMKEIFLSTRIKRVIKRNKEPAHEYVMLCTSCSAGETVKDGG